MVIFYFRGKNRMVHLEGNFFSRFHRKQKDKSRQRTDKYTWDHNVNHEVCWQPVQVKLNSNA